MLTMIDHSRSIGLQLLQQILFLLDLFLDSD